MGTVSRAQPLKLHVERAFPRSGEQPLWGLTENRRLADEAAVDANPLGADASLWFSGERSLSG